MASELQALSLVGCEGAEADALDLAGDFELDLWSWSVSVAVKFVL